jgi:hypothetical protein
MTRFDSTRSALILTFGLSLASGCDVGPAGQQDTADSQAGSSRDPTEQAGSSDDPAPALSADPQLPAHDRASGAQTEPAPAAPDPAAAPAAPNSVQVASAARALLKGRVTDAGAGKPALGLAGQGTLAAAAKLRVSALLPGGLLSTVADVALDASGEFEVKIPLDVELLVAQVLDASGDVLGAVLASVPDATSGQVIAIAPVDSQTSLEVKVLLDAASCAGMAAGKQDLAGLALDIHALIDAQLSSALSAALDAGLDLDLAIDALANASVSAGLARGHTLVDADVALDVQVLKQAALEALANLNLGLSTGLDLAQVDATLRADLDAALGAAGVSADLRVRANVAASLAFTSSLSASLAGQINVGPLQFAAQHAAAQLEVQVSASAVADLLKSGGASQATLDAALKAGADLKADVSLATDLQALIDARTDFVEALVGDPQSGGLISGLLSNTTSLVGGLLDPVFSLTSQLDAKLDANLDLVAKAQLCASVDASVAADLPLGGLVDSLTNFSSDVLALGPRIQLKGSAQLDADTLAKVLASAEIVLRLGPQS